MNGNRFSVGGLVLAAGAFALVVAVAVVGMGRPRVAVNGALPPDKAAYAGTWLGPGVLLKISPDASLSYRRVEGGTAKVLNAAITSFDGANVVAGASEGSTTLVVNHPPAEDRGSWRMEVDGVELVREHAMQQEAHAAVDIACKGVPGGLDCTLTHKLGANAVKACFEVTATCRNGNSASAQACDTVQPLQQQVHRVPTTDFKNLDQCDQLGGLRVHGLHLTPVE